jgi:5-methylcytosine-specific restriction protein A
MPSLEQVADNCDKVMGVKAVWGYSPEAVMGFSSLGSARAAAERAKDQPYLITIGGGRRVPPDYKGRVLEIVRVTGVYGNTNIFVRDPTHLAILEQWPVSVVLSEVYTVNGQPHLIDDLKLPDRRILEQAFDRVRRDNERMSQLWEAMRAISVTRREDILPPSGFRDPTEVVRCDVSYPSLTSASEEGQRVWKESIALERNRELSSNVKLINRHRNGGKIVCEACDLRADLPGLFDAHHLEPLATGIRVTRVDDFAVLCPTCHRWAHQLAADKLQPLKVSEVRARRAK